MFEKLFWQRYPKKKPKTRDTYLCTINYPFDTMRVEGKDNQWDWETVYGSYTMKLVYNNESDKFIDPRLKITDHLYDRTSRVVAWRKLPKPYKVKGRKYHESSKGGDLK